MFNKYTRCLNENYRYSIHIPCPYTYTYTQIIQLASIRRASAWIDVPDFASVLTVTGGRVADLSATFVGCE